MAKKTTNKFSGGSIFDIVKSFDDSAEILGKSKTAVINDYIDTGSYILNACISGSLLKGVPAGRCTVLAGEPGTGKTFLAISVCRNAQKKGYTPIYLDSESAIDLDQVSKLGADPNNFIIKQVTTVSEVSTFIARTCKSILDLPEEDRPKVMFVLDSLGNLTSEKELNDTIDGNDKKDMTRAQAVKALFRTNATALGKIHAPFIVNAHIYKTQDLFAKTVVSGGCLVPEEKIITKNGIKSIENIVVGDQVLTVDGTFNDVVKTFIYEKPTIKFTFEGGKTIECSEDHKFLVGEDPTVEENWKAAKDLNENDFVYEIVSGGI